MSKRMCLLGLLVCGLVWFGCSSDSSNEAASGGSMAKPMSTAQVALDGKAIGDAMQKATAWHMNMKSATAEMDMDVVCPDKSHMTSKAGGREVEMIRLGDDSYTRMGSKWMKMPGMKQPPVCGGATAPPESAAAAKAPALDPNIKLTKGGTETVNGETCNDYNWTANGKTSTVCIGNDHLPRLMKTAEATITYSNWNKPATIEAPKL